MMTIKTMKQIPTCKIVKGFRSGGSRLKSHSTEQSRLMAGYAEILNQEVRRQWLCKQWQEREVKVRG